jgi:hypothetical protein
VFGRERFPWYTRRARATVSCVLLSSKEAEPASCAPLKMDTLVAERVLRVWHRVSPILPTLLVALNAFPFQTLFGTAPKRV